MLELGVAIVLLTVRTVGLPGQITFPVAILTTVLTNISVMDADKAEGKYKDSQNSGKDDIKCVTVALCSNFARISIFAAKIAVVFTLQDASFPPCGSDQLPRADRRSIGTEYRCCRPSKRDGNLGGCR